MKTSNMTQKIETTFELTAQDMKNSLDGFGKEGKGADKHMVELLELINEQILQSFVGSKVALLADIFSVLSRRRSHVLQVPVYPHLSADLLCPLSVLASASH